MFKIVLFGTVYLLVRTECSFDSIQLRYNKYQSECLLATVWFSLLFDGGKINILNKYRYLIK